MKRAVIFLLLAAILFATGCKSTAPADLVGEYVTVLNGATLNVGKVTRDGSSYGMSWFANGAWIPVTAPVQVLTKTDLGRLVTGPVDGLAGLKAKELTILAVPRGWTQVYPGHNGAQNVEFKASTGYVWISPLGLMDLQKK